MKQPNAIDQAKAIIERMRNHCQTAEEDKLLWDTASLYGQILPNVIYTHTFETLLAGEILERNNSNE